MYRRGDVVWLKATTLEEFDVENPREPAIVMDSDGEMFGLSLFVASGPGDDGLREVGIDQIEGFVEPDTARVLQQLHHLWIAAEMK